MSFTENPEIRATHVTPQGLHAALIEALKTAHHAEGDIAKRVARRAGVPVSIVRYWLRVEYLTKTMDLLRLMATYPSVLKMVLESIGLPELWEAACAKNLPQRMQQRWRHTSHVARSWGDMHVSPPPSSAEHQHPTQNPRQQWFLAQLHQGHHPHAQDIAEHWRASLRTARRDLAGLVAAGAIRFERKGAGGCYALVEGRNSP